jgi:hypothetical protein
MSTPVSICPTSPVSEQRHFAGLVLVGPTLSLRRVLREGFGQWLKDFGLVAIGNYFCALMLVGHQL